ncbi:oligopeptide/dipeptide ABC transporter ATP-binding protein [Wenxinia marina]|uniref:Oligopeptide/dipeptide ABC transporter, ATP-binding protein n=1 Tax=Wenxinia marina DSM 24838 TaxID=1123501 RepID=A0A0D0NKJ6_9RHOB|nr:oligopeptide/dipeptide ABC transporter ATP-binding protein [Wenxinia marina]KIQ68845.1 oligopeptide/dipeptide ABC transporter, ATP-binding protein [Wenxinia marina DSM 24838]GGL64763.1 peptide ABC transporter ATP-binding protein [Wenxinia marina]
MSAPLLSCRDLSVTFDVNRRGAWPWTPPMKLRAVSDVSFDLAPGECLGVVGESGSGKSTLARAIVGTVPTSGGRIVFDGTELSSMSPRERRRHRKGVQMVFQDPLAALNPRMPVGDIIAEPLLTHHPDTPKKEVKARVQEMMERVGLLPNLINRYPHEFSGGQCQRIGIARALVLKPRLLICDEPVSALDVSVQAQVVNLLKELQRDMGLSMIFIAHDLSVVKHISDRIVVMYLGRLMEEAASRPLTTRPRHPYTQALIASVPIPDPVLEKARVRPIISGELPSPLNPPSGCVFRTRCPKARPDCAEGIPPMLEPEPGHFVACPYNEVQDVLAVADEAREKVT